MKKIDPEQFLQRVYSSSDLVSRDSELAHALDVPQRLISEWRRRESIPYSRCQQIATFLELNLDYLTGDEDDSNTVTLQHYGDTNLSAGEGLISLSEEPTEKVKVGFDFMQMYVTDNLKGLMVFPVDGDSMYPTIDHGDIVICRQGETVHNRQIHVIRYNGEIFVKRLVLKK